MVEESDDQGYQLYLRSMAHLLQIKYGSSSVSDIPFQRTNDEDRKQSASNNGNGGSDKDEVPMLVDEDGDDRKLLNAASTVQDDTYPKHVDISLENVATWKRGAMTATLRWLVNNPEQNNLREEGKNHSSRMEALSQFMFRSSKNPNSKTDNREGSKNGNPNAVNDVKRLKKDREFTFTSSTYGLHTHIDIPYKCPIPSGGKNLRLEDCSSSERKNVPNNLTSSTANSFFQPKPKQTSLFSSISSRNSGQDFPSNASFNVSGTSNAIGDVTSNADVEDPDPDRNKFFRTAYEQLIMNDKAKGIKRNLGNTNIGPPRKLAAPAPAGRGDGIEKLTKAPEVPQNPELAELLEHDQLKIFEPKLVEAVLSEVMEAPRRTDWNDIAGLEGPKKTIKEIIIWPMLRPDIFCGLRASPRGILLFGPPGNGKTMIGRLIATQSNSTFFNISASSLTSKWIGDGEKMVRCLFQVARIKQPSVIFIDEIDSILTQRSDTEHESSRRLKTEFLIQFDGCGTDAEDRVLVIGVTNRPQELDEAARRRLVKRIYIPLPDFDGRKKLLMNLMKDQNSDLSDEEFVQIATITEGYSGADMQSLCQDASYGPIRDIGDKLENIVADDVRPIQIQDFLQAVKRVKSSVAEKDLTIYEDWDEKFGCHVGD